MWKHTGGSHAHLHAPRRFVRVGSSNGCVLIDPFILTVQEVDEENIAICQKYLKRSGASEQKTAAWDKGSQHVQVVTLF